MKSFQLWAIICCLSIPRKCFSVLLPKSLLFNLTSKKASLKEKKLNFISTILPEMSDSTHFCNCFVPAMPVPSRYFCNFFLCQQKRNCSICFNQKCLQIIVNVFAVFCLCNKLPPHLVSLRISSTFGVSPSSSPGKAGSKKQIYRLSNLTSIAFHFDHIQFWKKVTVELKDQEKFELILSENTNGLLSLLFQQDRKPRSFTSPKVRLT